MSVDVRTISFATLASDPQFEGLTREYADECAMAGLPAPKAHIEGYLAMEDAGVMHTLGAYQGDLLVGFAIILVAVLPHYSERVANFESFFVGAQYRSTGAGNMLRSVGETVAKNAGALGVLVSAPLGSQLARAMAGLHAYRQTNLTFFKSLR